MAPERDLDLSVIIVSWNVRDLLRACLASLCSSPTVTFAGRGAPEAGGDNLHHRSGPPGQAGAGRAPAAGSHEIQAEVLVIDNASGDGTVAMLAAEFPWVRLIANPDNRGFTRANNQGLALSRGRCVFFLNPDTEVVADALVQMQTFLADHPAAGAVGPELRYADGAHQPSRRRFPTLAMALCESTPLAWHWPPERNPWARRYHMDDRPPGPGPEPVDWLVGAALMVRRATLDQVGGFDEGYFMYSEELDWCRRAAALGWQTVYMPAARVIHYEGKSSEQAVAARHIRFHTSRVRYFGKFYGPWPATVLRLLVLAMFAGEALLEGLKWLAGSRRALRAGRLAAYGEVIRALG